MGRSNPYAIRMDIAQKQRMPAPTVHLPHHKAPHVDKFGRIKLYCTRNFEHGCLVLRVRVQSAPDGTGRVRYTWPITALAMEIVKQDVFCPVLDSLVDMVRLQNPDYKFVVTKKYPGQKAV